MLGFYFGMQKFIKTNIKYIIFGGVFLLILNYYFFQKTLNQQLTLQPTETAVGAILKENNIQVQSVPAVYNIQDKQKIDFLTNDEIREKAEIRDQIVYYKEEKLLVLYRPAEKSIVAVTSIEK